MATDLVMVSRVHHAAAAGRHHARRLFLCAIVITLATALTRADGGVAPRVTVTETGGLYQVTASFMINEPPQAVIDVLTDYERIPRYMPDIEVSKVLERTSTTTVVEQQAVSRFLMFSKRVHLVLDVRESGNTLQFRDRCGKSFATYEGAWTISEHDSVTVVDYQLTARPMFEVPPFVLKRLLKRDSDLLIDRLKAEISERADRRR
jgi:carbon monoxide dehydrogenase subunit G